MKNLTLALLSLLFLTSCDSLVQAPPGSAPAPAPAPSSTATSTDTKVSERGPLKVPANCAAILKAADAGCPKPGQYQAVDLATYVDKKLADILACAGITTILRYYDWPGQETIKGKMPTKAEMDLLNGMGFKHARIFQHNNSKLATFTTERGVIDANHSIKQAREAGATKGRAIYFGVDGDFHTEADRAKIKSYFKAAAPLVRAAGFRVGMYGSGGNCEMLKAASLVDGELCWIAASSWGWSGTKAILEKGKGFALKQYVNKSCSGKSMDYNVAMQEDFGQW